MNQPKASAGRAGQAGRTRRTAPELIDPPRSVLQAVRLMYAGAVLTAAGLIADALYIVVHHSVRLSHPHATAAQIHATQSALLIALVFSGLLEIGAWIFMARANRGGLKWARIAGSVLFGIYTLYMLNIMLSGGAIVDLVLTFLVWLAGLGATFFLWRKESSDYFNAPTVA